MIKEACAYENVDNYMDGRFLYVTLTVAPSLRKVRTRLNDRFPRLRSIHFIHISLKKKV